MPGASRRQMSICGAVRRAFGTGLRGRTDSSPEKRRGLDGTLPHCSAPSFHPRLCHIIKNYEARKRKTHAGLGGNAIFEFSTREAGMIYLNVKEL